MCVTLMLDGLVFAQGLVQFGVALFGQQEPRAVEFDAPRGSGDRVP